MSCGPWKPIRIETFQARIEEIDIPYTISEDLSTATLNYTITVTSPPPNTTLELELHEPSPNNTTSNNPIYTETISATSTKITGTIDIGDPQLWYPHTHGKQPHYTLRLILASPSGPFDQLTHRLPLRRAQLIQRPLPNLKGTTFYFEINNIPIFAGGSNWIPPDTLLTRPSRETYESLLSLVEQGNQNMLRVWGGGVYERDEFYEICDDLGILVWQDFCFACGQYPGHPAFLDSVRREAEFQVKRLRKFACVVLWCGNNEDYQVAEAAKLDWNPDDREEERWLKGTFPGRYIYERILPEVVESLARGTEYHPGSPWGGKGTRDPTVGDIHQWNGTLNQLSIVNLQISSAFFLDLDVNGSMAWNSRTISSLPLPLRPICLRIRNAISPPPPQYLAIHHPFSLPSSSISRARPPQ